MHFLIKSKAKRGDNNAVLYNAQRFFDHFEDKTVKDIIKLRGGFLEDAFSRGLTLLGFLILTGGAGVLIRNFLAIFALLIFLFLLKDAIRLIKCARIRDQSLRLFLEWLRNTREQRREAFVGEMLRQAPAIAECRLS